MRTWSLWSSGMLIYRDVVARSKRRTDICEHLTRLYRLTADLPVRDKVVVELGVRHGESTTALIAAVNDSGGHLYSADIVDCSGVHRGEPNWTFILGDDMDIVKEWNRLIDHLFIDSGHTYEHTLAELREWGQWVKPGGIITLHDTNMPIYPGVPRAIEKYLEEHPSYGYIEHPECLGLGVIRKIKQGV